MSCQNKWQRWWKTSFWAKGVRLLKMSTNDWYQIVHRTSFYWIAHTSHLLVNIKGNTCTHDQCINDVMIMSSKSGLTIDWPMDWALPVNVFSIHHTYLSLAQGKCLQNINQLKVYFSRHHWCNDHIKSELLCILKGRDKKWIYVTKLLCLIKIETMISFYLSFVIFYLSIQGQ